MHAPPSWPQRFMRALPPISDRVSVAMLLLTVFLAGVGFGMAWRLPSPSTISPSVSQQQLDALERRLERLEDRLLRQP